MALGIVAVCAVLATRAQISTPPQPGAVLLKCDEVTESSGLARSRLEDDLLWTHNDSGDGPRLFAFGSQGGWRATVHLTKAKAIDWEDMCSFDRDGKHYLAVADSGDNLRQRKSVVIYGVEEPQLQTRPAADTPAKLSSDLRFEIHVRYPAGAADCEALAYDPWREQLILVTKESLRARIYAISFAPAGGRQETQAQEIGSVILPMVTGATISDDGQMLALATYGPTCLLRRPSATDWSKSTREQRKEATWVPPNADELELVPAPPRRQGEAVCFDRTGTRLLMTSEGHPMPLFNVDATSVKENETK